MDLLVHVVGSACALPGAANRVFAGVASLRRSPPRGGECDQSGFRQLQEADPREPQGLLAAASNAFPPGRVSGAAFQAVNSIISRVDTGLRPTRGWRSPGCQGNIPARVARATSAGPGRIPQRPNRAGKRFNCNGVPGRSVAGRPWCSHRQSAARGSGSARARDPCRPDRSSRTAIRSC